MNTVSTSSTRSPLTRAISRTASRDVREVVRGRPADDDVERAVGERQRLGAADDVGSHPRRGVARHDLEPGLAQPASDVAAAGRHVERGPRARRPLDEQVEIGALPVRVGVDVGLGPLAPDVARHARQLHRALRRLEHRRRDVEVRRAPPRRGCAGPPRRSSRRGGRRSAARATSRRAPGGSRARPRRSA